MYMSVCFYDFSLAIILQRDMLKSLDNKKKAFEFKKQ